MDSQMQDRISELLPSNCGKAVVLFALSNCPPCDSLKEILANLATANVPLIISELTGDDRNLKRLHFRVGVRQYPSFALIEKNKHFRLVAGFIVDGSGPVVTEVQNFIG